MEIIQNNDWSLNIDLDGGRIRELKYKDEIILGTFLRIDGKHGNTHVCCPNFGNEGDKDLPFHGPFRTKEWNLINKSLNNIEIETVDLGLRIRQVFDLRDGFEQLVVVENLGAGDRAANVAIHNYWAAEMGWQGTKLNGQIVDELIKSDISRPVLGDNVLEIPGKSVKRWNLTGFGFAQFWVSFSENEGQKKYDDGYVCIEPALEKQGFLDSGRNNLIANGKIEVSQRISF